MARTTDTLVGGIIEWDQVSVPDMTPFIDTANLIVTRCCADKDYTDTELEMIERWLSAWAYATRDPRALHERAGPVSIVYQTKLGLGFDNNHYGQTAMRLDYFGGLAKLNEQMKNGKIKPVMIWLGTCDEDTSTERCC